ncbi:hypothetical protein BGZ94_005527 [Podila epigama]|nr:hypothetical protein BGZ94_005527 [Podila epigama]
MNPTPGPPFMGGVTHPTPGAPPPLAFRPPPPPPTNWLPPGWTEHKAPDGMPYYYNAASGQSTWVKPTLQPPPPGPPGVPGVPGAIQPPFSQPYPMGQGIGQAPPPGIPQYRPPQQLLPPGVAAPSTGESSSKATQDPGKGKKSKKAKKEKAVKK